jgi:endonuclease/exonuclease/phosphatase (EEP) superfamily protein YafD
VSPGELVQVLYDVAWWAAIVATLVLCLATLLAETNLTPWWIRVWDFPRLQIALLLLAVSVVVPTLGWLRGGWSAFDVVLIVLALMAVIRQSMWIWPYLPWATREVPDADEPEASTGQELRVLLSNVLTPNDEYDLWRRVIGREEADIVVLTEPDQAWVDEASKLLDTTHPHKATIPLDNLYGLGVWTKLPAEDESVEYTVQDDIPSVHMTVTLASGDKVRVHVIHPRPPAPQESTSSAPRDAELVILGRRIAGADKGPDSLPSIACGDLNDVAWSRTTELFLKLSGMLDLRKGRGLFNTFHAGHWWMRFPLDHVFTDARFRFVEMRRLDDVGSDHYPLLVTVRLQNEDVTTEPTPDADDEKVAEEKLQAQFG